MKFKKMLIVSITILLSSILGVVSPTLAVEPEAAEIQTDYMGSMIASASAGNIHGGNAAASARNEKIECLGMNLQPVDFSDLYLLAKIINAEAGCEWLSDEWKMCVGEVVLNRVASPEFPDTVADVIYQRGQYYGSNSSYFNNLKPNDRCVRLALRLLEGERVMSDPSVVFQANFRQGSSVHTEFYDSALGSTYFCRSSKPALYL